MDASRASAPGFLFVYTVYNSMSSTELRKVDAWMKPNRLAINIKKTNYVIFKSKQKRVNAIYSCNLIFKVSIWPVGFLQF